MKIPTASSSSSPQSSGLASLLDFNPGNISNNSDEEEDNKVEQHDAMIAKIKAHKEQLLGKTPIKSEAVRLQVLRRVR